MYVTAIEGEESGTGVDRDLSYSFGLLLRVGRGIEGVR